MTARICFRNSRYSHNVILGEKRVGKVKAAIKLIVKNCWRPEISALCVPKKCVLVLFAFHHSGTINMMSVFAFRPDALIFARED